MYGVDKLGGREHSQLCFRPFHKIKMSLPQLGQLIDLTDKTIDTTFMNVRSSDSITFMVWKTDSDVRGDAKGHCLITDCLCTIIAPEELNSHKEDNHTIHLLDLRV